MIARLFVYGFVLLLVTTPAAAQEYQAGRAPMAYVSEVLKLPTVNYPVILTGYLVQKAGDEKYLFQDDTGAMQASIPKEALYNVTVDGRRVTIRGNVAVVGDVIEIAVNSVSQAE